MGPTSCNGIAWSPNMTHSKTAYLTALAEGRKLTEIPAWLKAEARAVARRYDGQLQPEDIVQAFFESILIEGARNRARVPWRDLTEAQAVAMVRRRMGQLACEQAEGWNDYRSVRAHVAGVLEIGLPPPPDARPATILQADRLSRKQVALAAAWLVAREHVPAEVRALTAALRKIYLLQWATPSDDAFERMPDAGLLADDDVEVDELVRDVLDQVGADDTRLVMRRLHDIGLKALGQEMGLSTTTTFEKARKAELRVALAFRESGCPEHVARRALGRLAEAFAP